MDPLSLTCNIAGVLTVAAQLISIGYSYGSSVADFPREIQELVGELTSLSGILSALKAVIDQPPLYHVDGSTNIQPSLIGEFINDPLEDCEEILQKLLESLESQNVGSKIRKIFKRVTWPLKEGETKNLFAKLERYKRTFSLALSADEITLTRSIYNDIGEIKRHQTIEIERKELATRNERFLKIIRWLSPADPEINHVAARQLQQAGTGKWFTKGIIFQKWLLPNNSFLWLHGKPGAGKTILSSMIIDRVMSEVYTSSNIAPAVIYFYCDFKDRSKQTALGLLGSLIAQLVQKKSEMPDDVENLYHRSNNGDKLPEINSLEECLHSVIKGFSKVAVIIDALDECIERDPVFERLRRLGRNTNILITSRDELDIKLEFENLPSLLISENDVSIDIECFVTHEIARQPKLKRLKPTTKSDIITTLVKGANGMFRWAKCCLDEIIKLRSDKAIKSALKSLPRTLESSYERILCNIAEEDRILAIRIFQWLLASQRPLKVWEVVDAIAVEIRDVSMDPDSKINDPEDITHICGGLVDLNRWNMTLGFAHFTVEEYLTSNSINQSPAAAYRIQLQVAHTELAKICLTYVLFDDFNIGPCKTEDEFLTRLENYPLLCYAPFFWSEHIRKYESGNDKTLDDLILSFFRLEHDSEKFLLWLQVKKSGVHRKLTTEDMNYYERALETPLYVAAEMGQLPAMKDLLERGTNIHAKGGYLGTPLSVASSEGHLEVLQLLLDKGAGLVQDIGEKSYRPLHNPMRQAASHGFADCVQLLLDQCSDSEERSEWISCCENAIQAVAVNTQEKVMEVFLATDYFKQVPPIEDANNSSQMHPFLNAFLICVHNGWEKYIRSLWEMGCDVLISANEHKLFIICLTTAAMYGHVRVLKIILQNNKAKSICAQHGIYTALLQEAAYHGQDKIVDFLLGLGEISGDEGMGLSLHIAAAKGQIGIMERLLRAGADPLRKDDDGWSPLVYASQYREDSAVEKLSPFADLSEILETKVAPNSWDLNLKEAIANGPEIKVSAGFATRALYPISPLHIDYSFEVEIIESSCWTIGFGDIPYSLTLAGEYMFKREPGFSDMSWGYSRQGNIIFADREDKQTAGSYGVGDIVGCHFDRTRSIAFFTVNGKIAGKPIANIKGKLVPMIDLSEEARIRTNFGGSPLVYPMPNLSTETLNDTWEASDAWWSVGLAYEPPKPLI